METVVQRRADKRYGVRFTDALPWRNSGGVIVGLRVQGVDKPNEQGLERWLYEVVVSFADFGVWANRVERAFVAEVRIEEQHWARAHNAVEMEERVADRVRTYEPMLLRDTLEAIIREAGTPVVRYR